MIIIGDNVYIDSLPISTYQIERILTDKKEVATVQG